MGAELICLGDSLTFGLGVPHDRRWTSLVERRSRWRTVNLGVCGDTTGGMLSRLGTEVLPRLRGQHSAPIPALVFLMGGSNDIIYAQSQREARANLGAMVHQVKHSGHMPVVGIPPVLEAGSAAGHWGAEVTDFPVCAGLLEEYGRWLAGFCRAFRVPCADFRPIFTLPGAGAAAERFLDGIHPNEASHERMAAVVLDVLEKVTGPLLEDHP